MNLKFIIEQKLENIKVFIVARDNGADFIALF